MERQRSLGADPVDQEAEIEHRGDASQRVKARGEDGVGRCHAGQVQYLRQPEDKEVEIEQAAKEDDPQQRRL